MADILTFSDIYTAMKSFFIANQDVITDINSDNALDTQLKAFATQLSQAYTKMSGSFKKQFDSIPFQFFDFERGQAEFASSTVIFSRQVATTDPVTIPIGTVVSDNVGNLYTTQADAIILANETLSSVVDVIANEVGSQANGTIDSITIITSSVEGVNSVTNNSAITGGTDKETNAQYFIRFTEFVLGLQGSNKYGIKSAAEAVSGIQSAEVDEHFPPESGIYNYTVYVDDGSGSTPQSLLDQVYLELYGNDTEEYQGYNASGINFRVLAATLVSINVDVEIDADPVSGDETLIESLIEQAVLNYVGNLRIGEDVLRSRLNSLFMSIQNVYNINSLTLNSLSQDVSVAAAEVARPGTINVTFSSTHPR